MFVITCGWGRVPKVLTSPSNDVHVLIVQNRKVYSLGYHSHVRLRKGMSSSHM